MAPIYQLEDSRRLIECAPSATHPTVHPEYLDGPFDVAGARHEGDAVHQPSANVPGATGHEGGAAEEHGVDVCRLQQRDGVRCRLEEKLVVVPRMAIDPSQSTERRVFELESLQIAEQLREHSKGLALQMVDTGSSCPEFDPGLDSRSTVTESGAQQLQLIRVWPRAGRTPARAGSRQWSRGHLSSGRTCAHHVGTQCDPPPRRAPRRA
jgi:hypothetical protein